MTELVHLELATVALLELDAPPLNLVTGELLGRLDAALAQLEGADPGGVRAVVVTGRGERAFSVGSNVKEFEDHRASGGRARFELEASVAQRLAALPMPTIAAIEGAALGGGLELALCCDLRVASERATLGMPELRLGVIPGSGVTQLLPHVVVPARAKELILLGEIIDARTAEGYGLVNRVVPAGEAMDAAREWAATIASRGPLAEREAKRLIDLASETELDAGMAAELDASERIFSSNDMIEGARAFFDKRPPEFSGD